MQSKTRITWNAFRQLRSYGVPVEDARRMARPIGIRRYRAALKLELIRRDGQI